jgi:hypothetical protein
MLTTSVVDTGGNMPPATFGTNGKFAASVTTVNERNSKWHCSDKKQGPWEDDS